MKPTQSDIITKYLNSGIEVYATYLRSDATDSNIHGSINCIFKDQLFHCTLKEIRSDNKNYFDNGYDRDQEYTFTQIAHLLLFVKNETNLELNDFSKAGNFVCYRY